MNLLILIFFSKTQNGPFKEKEMLVTVKGCVLPLQKLSHVNVGKNKGIQGYHNSCYMDSTLFAMFAFCDVFDVALHRKARKDALDDYGEVQRLLREKHCKSFKKVSK